MNLIIKTMNTKIIFILIFLFFSNILISQEENDSTIVRTNEDSTTIYKLSINEAKDYAVEHNYQNQNSKIDIAIAKKKIWETTAIGLPQINAEASYNNSLEIPTTLMPGAIMGQPGTQIPVQFGQQHGLTGTITATQLIFSGEYIVGLQASKVFLEISKQAYSKSTKTIKETVTKSYYLVLIAEESKKILEETGKNFESLLKEIEASYNQGLIEDIDVDQLRLTKQNNDNTLISINSQIELSKRLLKYQLGINFTDSLILTDSIELFIENLDSDSIMIKEFNIENNIDYKMIQIQEEVAELELKREKSAYLPQLAAFLTHSENTYHNEFEELGSDWYPSTILGFKLTIPIFSSGSRRSKVQQKKLKLEKAKNTRLEVYQTLNMQVEQSKINFINAKNKYENQKLSLNLSKRINNKTEIKYKNGVSSSNELMIAQNQYLGTLSNYYQALSKLLETRASLEYVLLEE